MGSYEERTYAHRTRTRALVTILSDTGLILCLWLAVRICFVNVTVTGERWQYAMYPSYPDHVHVRIYTKVIPTDVSNQRKYKLVRVFTTNTKNMNFLLQVVCFGITLCVYNLCICIQPWMTLKRNFIFVWFHRCFLLSLS